MIAAAPATAAWAREVMAVVDDGGTPVWVHGRRRLGRVALEQVTAPPARGVAVTAVLRQREGFLRWVEAPLSSPRKAQRVFPSLLDVQLPFPLEDCTFAFVDARQGANGSTARGLAVGARNADIERRLEALAAAGIVPHVLDNEALALWTQSRAEDGAGTEPPARVVVYETADRLTLVVGRADEVLGAHSFKDYDADALQRTLRLHFPEPPAALHWFWTGPGADKTAVRTRHAALTPRWPGTVTVAAEPAAFLARALATRALTSGPLRLNLRQGRLAHPDIADRARRAPMKAALSCLAAGLALCAVNAGWSIAINARLNHLQASVRAAAIRAAGSERLVPRGQERLGAERACADQARLYAPLTAPFAPPVTTPLMAILEAARAEGLRVQTVSATRSLVMLRATASSWRQCETVLQRLRARGFTARAERKGESTERMPVVLNVEVPHGL